MFVILVNWNNYADTIDCLKSLIRVTYRNFKIVLIDNHSEDGSVQKIAEWAENSGIPLRVLDCNELSSASQNVCFVTVVPLSDNIGFGAANNIGIKFSMRHGADYLLLLNNDTVVKEDFLNHMLRTALDKKNVGVVGGKIRYFSNKDKVWFSGGYIDFIRGAFYHRNDDCNGTVESEFITGCLMLIPSFVINEVGFFDDHYFLNVEDVDLSSRIRDAGYRLIVDCNALVYHKVSASIGGIYSKRHQYYFHRNRMIFFGHRLTGMKRLLFFSVQSLLLIPLWIIIQLFKGRRQAVIGALTGYLDYFKGFLVNRSFD